MSGSRAGSDGPAVPGLGPEPSGGPAGRARRRRRGAIVVLALACVPLLGARPAAAAGSRFASVNATVGVGTGTLEVSFAEMGLLAGGAIADQARADATVGYGCRDGTGRTDGSASEVVSASVAQVGWFVPGADGSVRAALSLPAPGPGSFTCRPGEQMILTSVTYTDVSVTDLTNGIGQSVAGTFAQLRVGP
ncbi:MAG TPA: hypothetical protein VKY90_00565 [Candidatus Dormibacteraeota bacterium]|nr:hypothetical protein [Candidatus Dormibacteraeota bacterium]